MINSKVKQHLLNKYVQSTRSCLTKQVKKYRHLRIYPNRVPTLVIK